MPGLSALGQAVIITQAASRELSWLVVGIAGGLGMGLGEVPVYYSGTAGRHVAKGKRRPGPRWLGHSVGWGERLIDRLMERHGAPTIFVLSAIPNLTLEVGAPSAGASGLVLAYLAQYIPFT